MESQNDIVHLQAAITCPKCGGKEVHYDPELGDESPVTCSACGESLGKLSEAKEVATNKALNGLFEAEVKKAFGEAFQGEDGITFEPKE